VKKKYSKKEKKGFTLVEVLAVLVIIALLMAIAVPTSISVSKKVKIKMLNNKVQLAEKAAALWANDNLNCLKDNTCPAFKIPTNSNQNEYTLVCESPNSLGIKKCTITIGELANENYFEYDDDAKTIVQNPVNKSSLNDQKVEISINTNNNSVNVTPVDITIANPIAKIVFSGKNCTNTYTGAAQSCHDYTYSITNPKTGKTMTLSEAKISKIDDTTIQYIDDSNNPNLNNKTDVGKYNYKLSNVIVRDANGKDISKKYDILYESGSLTINPIQLKVIVSNCTVDYNGSSQQCSLSNIHITGTIANGEQLNNNTKIPTGTYVKTYTSDVNLTVTTTDGKIDKTTNYDITKDLQLSLYIIQVPIKIVSNTCNIKTDGTSKDCGGIMYTISGTSGSVTSSSNTVLPTGDTLQDNGSTISGTKAGSYKVPVKISILKDTTNVESNYAISEVSGSLELVDKTLYSSSINPTGSGLTSSNVNDSQNTTDSVNTITSQSASYGTISGTSFSGNTISYSGNAEQYLYNSYNTTVSTMTYSRSATAITEYGCDSYYCNNGGNLSGSTCVANRNNIFTVVGSCPCAYNSTSKTWGKGAGSCTNIGCEGELHYTRTKTTYYGKSTVDAGCNALKSTPMNVYGDCTWQGNYPATCSSSSQHVIGYTCNSNEYQSGTECYYCDSNSYMSNGSCYRDQPVYIYRYRYNYTINYNYWK
jgi:prepilin-type N-terminal cleavage/methylation domain-containing protein